MHIFFKNKVLNERYIKLLSHRRIKYACHSLLSAFASATLCNNHAYRSQTSTSPRWTDSVKGVIHGKLYAGHRDLLAAEFAAEQISGTDCPHHSECIRSYLDNAGGWKTSRTFPPFKSVLKIENTNISLWQSYRHNVCTPFPFRYVYFTVPNVQLIAFKILLDSKGNGGIIKHYT